MTRPTVSVIIPSYNEVENVPILIERLVKLLSDMPHEIIVVDDNSPDGTWEVAEKMAERTPGLRVIRRLNERGLSSAVVTGMSAAAGETLAVMDADLQHDENILPEMVRTLIDDGYDIAIGSRGVTGGSYGEFSKRRRFISWVAATMARMLLPIKVLDPMSGFFAVKRDLFLSSADRINPLGFKILLEFIGRNAKARIKEVPYTFRLREHGETKLSGSVIKNYLVALYDLKFGKYVSARFMLYSLVGSTGVLINMGGFFLGEYLNFPQLHTGLGGSLDPLYISVPFGIQLSIFSNYILNNYLTFYEHRHRGWQNIRGLVLFEIVSMLGVLIQWGVMQFLFNNGFLAGLISEAIRKPAANMIGIIVALVSNYYLNVNFTWQSKRKT